ncbi:hypothetical protein [Cystobacter fuscus]|nr:hypothetical protein [Cystobacter fuscus]
MAARGARRRPTAASRPARRWRWGLAALLLLFMLFWLWPSTPEPVPPPVAVPEAPPPPPVVTRPVVKKKVAPKPSPPPPAAPMSSQRALLRRAMEARAPDLRACALPPGAPTTLGARIRVARGGATKSVAFASGQRLPRELAECLRQRLLQWEFSDVGLSSDVEIFVDFALGG